MSATIVIRKPSKYVNPRKKLKFQNRLLAIVGVKGFLDMRCPILKNIQQDICINQ
ncbi:hypothetical protein BRYFOR_05481 [Marvinbryantia formatexigens DSM 14469]|uniref:Uncharacterized protein n=1 Tax=Marvinbryantia formatexigens DSM 14469 TaxID=478749 RepID=C6LA39_9FIRM|nr:hypothetical protein BRYFOR_05481 [Marvinbryantia formatexigens DSM 14469]